MLKNFYTAYITERSKMPQNSEKIDSIVKRFGSTKLQKQRKNPEIDYDLLLDGQFCEMEWLNSMVISRDKVNDHLYTVSFDYLIDNEKKQKNIHLLILKDNSSYKIDSVIP